MVRLKDLPPEYAEGLRNLAMPEFESTPWTPGPELGEARIAIVTTAGLHRASDPKFAGGSADYRLLPADLDYSELMMSHVSANFDRSGFQQDIGTVFPLEHLKDMPRTVRSAQWHAGTTPSWAQLTRHAWSTRRRRLPVCSRKMV